MTSSKNSGLQVVTNTKTQISIKLKSRIYLTVMMSHEILVCQLDTLFVLFIITPYKSSCSASIQIKTWLGSKTTRFPSLNGKPSGEQ